MLATATSAVLDRALDRRDRAEAFFREPAGGSGIDALLDQLPGPLVDVEGDFAVGFLARRGAEDRAVASPGHAGCSDARRTFWMARANWFQLADSLRSWARPW